MMNEQPGANPPMYIGWLMPPGPDFKRIEEFRIYKKVGLADDETAPFTLAGTVRRVNRRWNLFFEGSFFDSYGLPNDAYSLDTFYSVASVDRDGKEGGLAPPGY